MQKVLAANKIHFAAKSKVKFQPSSLKNNKSAVVANDEGDKAWNWKSSYDKPKKPVGLPFNIRTIRNKVLDLNHLTKGTTKQTL